MSGGSIRRMVRGGLGWLGGWVGAVLSSGARRPFWAIRTIGRPRKPGGRPRAARKQEGGQGGRAQAAPTDRDQVW